MSLCLVGGMGLAGCRTRTQRVIPPEERRLDAQTASRDELLALVTGLQSGISTLIGADVTYIATALGQTTGVELEYRETDGVLRVDRPDDIRMLGRAVLGSVIVFDMVADREVFRVNLPARNQFIQGATDSVMCTDNPMYNLRPQHIMDALFVDVSPYLDDAGVRNVLEEVAEGPNRYYVLSFVRTDRGPAELLEKVWVDRFDLSVTRKQLFGEEGVLHTDVAYSEWDLFDENWFPRRIVVQRPIEDYELEIRFREVFLNAEPDDAAFLIARPVGSELIDVDAAGGPCDREADQAVN